MISLAFYWSLAVSQFFDVKRKDFWQMFIHHVAAICLMGFSWMCNLHRIGTLVLLTHDCSDIFLEVGYRWLKFVYEFLSICFKWTHLSVHLPTCHYITVHAPSV
jgi:ceramide synthetase